MASIERVVKYFSCLSNLGLAACYLLTWAGVPLLGGESAFPSLASVIGMEFILMIFGALLVALLVGPTRESIIKDGDPKNYTAILTGLAVALVLIGVYYSSRISRLWPLINIVNFLTVHANLYFHPPKSRLESNQIMTGPALRCILLFFLFWPCVLIPFPAWGVGGWSVFGGLPPAGIVIWGALYFGLIGLYRYRWEAAMVASSQWKD